MIISVSWAEKRISFGILRFTELSKSKARPVMQMNKVGPMKGNGAWWWDLEKL